MHNHLNGQLAEMIFMTQAIERGYQVYTPMSHHSKIDVVICKPGKPLIGVQVKKASRQKKENGEYGESWKVLVGSARSGRAGQGRRPRLKRYTAGMFDILCVYVTEPHNCFAFYKLDDVAGVASMRWSKKKGIEDNWQIFD